MRRNLKCWNSCSAVASLRVHHSASEIHFDKSRFEKMSISLFIDNSQRLFQRHFSLILFPWFVFIGCVGRQLLHQISSSRLWIEIDWWIEIANDTDRGPSRVTLLSNGLNSLGKKKQLKELEIHRIDEKLTEIGEKLAKNWRQVAEIERNWCEIAKNQLLTIHQKMKIDLK